MDQAKPILDILKSDCHSLNQLVERALALQPLLEEVQHHLGEELGPHCQAIAYQDNVLTLLIPSANWATRIRFCLPDLLSTLRKEMRWCALKSLKIKIQSPAPSTPAPSLNAPPSQVRHMSKETSAALQALAEQLNNEPNNTPLKKSLNRLSKLIEAKEHHSET